MVEKNMPACKKWELYVKGELFYDEISICLKIVKTLTSGKKKELESDPKKLHKLKFQWIIHNYGYNNFIIHWLRIGYIS